MAQEPTTQFPSHCVAARDWLITVYSRNLEARGVTQSLITNTVSREKSISFQSLKPTLKASQSRFKYMQACTKYCLLRTGGCIPLHNNTGSRRCSIGLMASFLLVFDKREVITGQPVSRQRLYAIPSAATNRQPLPWPDFNYTIFIFPPRVHTSWKQPCPPDTAQTASSITIAMTNINFTKGLLFCRLLKSNCKPHFFQSDYYDANIIPWGLVFLHQNIFTPQQAGVTWLYIEVLVKRQLIFQNRVEKSSMEAQVVNWCH